MLNEIEEENDALGDLPLCTSTSKSLSSSSSTMAAAQKRDHSRRHSRIHSRNLSVFFPPPGSDAEREADIIAAYDTSNRRPTIELDTHRIDNAGLPDIANDQSHMASSLTHKNECSPSSAHSAESISGPSRSRKGHHRRHSVVHGQEDSSQRPLSGRHVHLTSESQAVGAALSNQARNGTSSVSHYRRNYLTFGLCEFLLGSYLWWKGQSGDSLATAGMGYLTVFDALPLITFGANPIIARSSKRRDVKADQGIIEVGYDRLRVESLLHFTQTIYLLFAAIYVCKESVEHALLEGSNDDHEEDDVGLHLPLVLLSLSAACTTFSNLFLHNHAQLVAACNLSTAASESLPAQRTASLRGRHGRTTSILADPVVIAGPFLDLLANPFSVTILFFNYALIICALVLQPTQIIALDKVLAGLQSSAMLYIAFPASKALGKILLQTAPLPHDVQHVQLMRSLQTIGEHPLVTDVAAPKSWQLTPPTLIRSGRASQDIRSLTSAHRTEGCIPKRATLVSSVEICVAGNATDGDILDLTRWAWQLLAPSVGAAAGLNIGDSMRGALRAGEITVQVIRRVD